MSSSVSAPDVSNAFIQTDQMSNLNTSIHEFEPNTRFVIVSYCNDQYTLMETGSADDHKEKVRDFIMREFQSEFDTCKSNSGKSTCIDYKVRVYAYTDEAPFDIDTSEIIFSTANCANVQSLGLPCEWELIYRDDGLCIEHNFISKHDDMHRCVVIWLR